MISGYQGLKLTAEQPMDTIGNFHGFRGLRLTAERELDLFRSFEKFSRILRVATYPPNNH